MANDEWDATFIFGCLSPLQLNVYAEKGMRNKFITNVNQR